MHTPSDYLNNATTMLHTSFPEEEKARHCKELLAQMRNQYGSLLTQDAHILAYYQQIASFIDRSSASDR